HPSRRPHCTLAEPTWCTSSPALPPLLPSSAPSTPATSSLSLHDALPICIELRRANDGRLRGSIEVAMEARSIAWSWDGTLIATRSEEHTSELQSLRHLVCRLLLEKKNALRAVISGLYSLRWAVYRHVSAL